MKPRRKTRLTFTSNYSETTPPSPKSIPVITSSDSPALPITVIHHPTPPSQSTAATKIQSTYRSHLMRTLYKTISTVNSATTHLENEIQQQETIDTIRSSGQEHLRLNESLMALLLKLDSVPGVDPTVREARRKVSRRIVGLQEIVDAVSDSRTVGLEEMMWKWEETVVEMEEGIWREDDERERRREMDMERFCFEKLGFRCMERFLRGV